MQVSGTTWKGRERWGDIKGGVRESLSKQQRVSHLKNHLEFLHMLMRERKIFNLEKVKKDQNDNFMIFSFFISYFTLKFHFNPQNLTQKCFNNLKKGSKVVRAVFAV